MRVSLVFNKGRVAEETCGQSFLGGERCVQPERYYVISIILTVVAIILVSVLQISSWTTE